jgi:hypothetical protein
VLINLLIQETVSLFLGITLWVPLSTEQYVPRYEIRDYKSDTVMSLTVSLHLQMLCTPQVVVQAFGLMNEATIAITTYNNAISAQVFQVVVRSRFRHVLCTYI